VGGAKRRGMEGAQIGSGPDLFVAYGSPFFAQDETQDAEHPPLCSLQEALVATGSVALTVSGDPSASNLAGHPSASRPPWVEMTYAVSPSCAG
jgi:hypothetical protein